MPEPHLPKNVYDRAEYVARGNHPDIRELMPGVIGRLMVSEKCGAQNLCTAISDVSIKAQRAYHKHKFSEVITPLNDLLVVSVEGRRYVLKAYESVHIPAGCTHTAYSSSNLKAASALSAFACALPTREFVAMDFPYVDRGYGCAHENDPEFVARHDLIEIYELNEGARFRDLFASRYGSSGICGGYAEFEPGSSLPCHYHQYDESITIVNGTAICEVAGKRYTVSDNDTVLVPKGRPHRFLNESHGLMVMVWVYAGDEPERTLLEPSYCIGNESCPC